MRADREIRYEIQPGRPLRGEVRLPGDKSISHRAALFAALAEGESRVENFLPAGVTQAMLEALGRLGVEWRLDGSTLTVQGRGLEGLAGRGGSPRLDCGNSATTLRLLAGALAASGAAAVLDGSPGLRRRPMDRIVAPLQAMGVPITSQGGCAPLQIERARRPLRPLETRLPVASAQVKTCLLLAGLAASGPSTITEPGPSRDHTERMFGSMGVRVVSERADGNEQKGGMGNQVKVWPATDPLRPLRIDIPGDISSAAFLIVAALITPGSEVVLQGVGLNPTRTGLLDALQAMGADIKVENHGEQGGEPTGDLRVRHSSLAAAEVSGPLVVRMIDEFPVYAAAAAYAQGRTVVRDAVELRHKESDRISALCSELSALGAVVEEAPDGFAIEGRSGLAGGSGRSHGDHRLAMSLAVAGLAARRPVIVHGAQMVNESFPGFASVLEQLGAEIRVQSVRVHSE